MTPPPDRRDPREDLRLPMFLAALLAGSSLLAAIPFGSPRVGLALLALALIVILAILRELIFPGDR